MDRVPTRRGALLELAIITAGVLIALSFDGVRGWIAERTLVVEARAHLVNELRDNRTALDNFLKTIPDRERELATVRSIAETRLAGQPLPTSEASLNYVLADVTSASRTSAEITGAFALMTYDEVKEFALIYDLQQHFTRLQDEILVLMRPVLAGVTLIDAPMPSTSDLETWLRAIAAADAQLLFVKQIGEQLSAGYTKVLDRARQD